MKKTVLVAEFGDSHTELLYSHKILLEDAGYKVVFFLNDKLKKRIDGLEQNEVLFFSEQESKSKTLSFLSNILKSRQIHLMIDNSAHSNYIRDFLPHKLMMPRLRVVGVCHYVKKLKTSFNQWLISRVVDKYLILSRLFFENASLKQNKRIAVFYPVYFPNPPRTTNQINFPIQIVVPGGLELRSKDYLTLYQSLGNELKSKIHITFLGNGAASEGLLFREKVSQDGMESFFTFFDGYVPAHRFREVLSQAHLIAPLINPEMPAHRDYVESKISGAYNLAYSLKIPMLLHRYFAPYSDFREFCIFYDNSALHQALATLNPKQILEKKDQLTKATRYQFEYQKSVYQSFVCN